MTDPRAPFPGERIIRLDGPGPFPYPPIEPIRPAPLPESDGTVQTFGGARFMGGQVLPPPDPEPTEVELRSVFEGDVLELIYPGGGAVRGTIQSVNDKQVVIDSHVYDWSEFEAVEILHRGEPPTPPTTVPAVPADLPITPFTAINALVQLPPPAASEWVQLVLIPHPDHGQVWMTTACTPFDFGQYPVTGYELIAEPTRDAVLRFVGEVAQWVDTPHHRILAGHALSRYGVNVVGN